MKIKICGLTRSYDVDYINAARPDFCGFVFAPSRRQVTAMQAEKLREKLLNDIIPVGVFVDEPLKNIVWLLENHIIRWIQLHGNEDENYIERLRNLTEGKYPIIRAIRVTSVTDILMAERTHADYLLLDHGAGGTGKNFNWNVLRDRSPIQKPFFLAGGVNLQNLDKATRLGAFALDISSGVETDGVKDREKIIEITRKIKNKENENYV